MHFLFDKVYFNPCRQRKRPPPPDFYNISIQNLNRRSPDFIRHTAWRNSAVHLKGSGYLCSSDCHFQQVFNHVSLINTFCPTCHISPRLQVITTEYSANSPAIIGSCHCEWCAEMRAGVSNSQRCASAYHHRFHSPAEVRSLPRSWSLQRWWSCSPPPASRHLEEAAWYLENTTKMCFRCEIRQEWRRR